MQPGKLAPILPIFSRILPSAAVLGGGAAHRLPEQLAEIAAAAQAAGPPDLGQRHFAPGQHLAGRLQAVRPDVGRRGGVQAVAEQAEALPLAEVGRGRQLRARGKSPSRPGRRCKGSRGQNPAGVLPCCLRRTRCRGSISWGAPFRTKSAPPAFDRACGARDAGQGQSSLSSSSVSMACSMIWSIVSAWRAAFWRSMRALTVSFSRV